MDNVQRMAESVTTLCYLSSMDSLSMSLCQRIEDALRQREHQVQENIKLEKQYYLLQEQIIKSKLKKNKIQEKLFNMFILFFYSRRGQKSSRKIIK